ncbi:hypothetical protein HPP92_001638 [Vanilla planifolia]|uniref:Uncharacterized protein n=1 Tax=Vanilla planifolia TaxID=51239 RepID=A0A835VM09_VANPL|nr:hypothetical protein HPP92_001638 [Vanilla planifolia]
MHKMPRIWIMFITTLCDQRLITRARRTCDRSLCALPVTQHDRIWSPYLTLVSLPGVPVETSLRVYRRYLLFDPSHIEDFIDFLLRSQLWQEASERLASVLNNDSFHSIKGKTRHQLWLELCDLLTRHATEVSGLKVDAIIRGGIRKYSDEIGRLWTSLADYYVRRGLYEKARDIFEEGLASVVTVRDFSVIFDSYAQFEQSALAAKIETAENNSKDSDEDDDVLRNGIEKLSKKFLEGFWLNDDDDADLRMARLEALFDRRPELLNSVLLRQNPHNVEQWHRRVKLFEGNPTRQILTFTEAVRTVDPMKAVGKPHIVGIICTVIENHNDLVNAGVVFDKAVQVNYKTVDNLASVWCEWAEMELRHKNFQAALELMKRSTAEPSVEVKRRVAVDGNEPVQMRLHRSLRLWSFYVDLEESLGTLESTRTVYERILDLRIATPQIILNFAYFLEEHKYFEDAFKVYERGIKIFKYPHVKDIWVTYLSKFVKRYGKSKLERARELFENAIEKGSMVLAIITRSDIGQWHLWQTHFILPENLMQKDQSLNLEEAVDTLKRAGVPENEMAALEKQLTSSSNLSSKNANKMPSFVSAGVEFQPDGNRNMDANKEDIELPEESDSDDENIEISQKVVPSAVFGELANKVATDQKRDSSAAEESNNNAPLGALERIKRQRKQ